MPEIQEQRLDELTRAIEDGTRQKVWKMLNDLHGAEIAHLLEALPVEERLIAWRLVNSENEGEVLLHVNDEVRGGLIRNTNSVDLIAAAEHMELDDLADFLVDLPETVKTEVLHSMDNQNRQRLETVLSYSEDSAGGLMNTDTVTVRADVTLELVHRYLQLRGQLPDSTDKLIVVNRFDHYLGALPLATLLTSDSGLTVSEVMDRDFEAIPVDTPSSQVANLFEQHDLLSAPVIDKDNTLLGRITIDDVVDVIRDEADHSIMRRAGLDEEGDMFAPVLVSAQRRAVWLGINLVTAFLAVWFISLFQMVIEKKAQLAILMPLAASMGGVAGTQTLTLVIRGIALGQISRANAHWLLVKELAVAIVNGLLWALLVASIAFLWFKDSQLGILIGITMLLNLVCAAIAGFFVPFGLKRAGIDPAIAGSVVVTTATDVVGYTTFLGLATLFLL